MTTYCEESTRLNLRDGQVFSIITIVKQLERKRSIFCTIQVAREALCEGEGSVKVFCLRIDNPDGDVFWLYESDAIIRYLQTRFG